MKEQGVVWICDWCGINIFVKAGRKYFQDAPKDWTNFGNKDLCPECSRKYDGIIKDAFEKQ